MVLGLIRKIDMREKAHDNRDMISGWDHSEKVKLLPAEVLCGCNENIPFSFSPFLLTEPSVRNFFFRPGNFCSVCLALIYDVSLKKNLNQ